MTSCQQIFTSLSFFQLITNLEQSGSWILDAQYVKLTFSKIVTFYLAKTENRTKKSPTQLSHCCFKQSYYLKMLKNADFLQKNADISKIKWVLVLKDRREGVVILLSPSQNKPLTSPPRLGLSWCDQSFLDMSSAPLKSNEKYLRS